MSNAVDFSIGKAKVWVRTEEQVVRSPGAPPSIWSDWDWIASGIEWGPDFELIGEAENLIGDDGVVEQLDYYTCPDCGGEAVDHDCPDCGGSGHEDCPVCQGEGSIVSEIDCPACDGSGEDDGLDCQTCGGKGTIEDKKECSNCGGSGERDCPTCYGVGTIEGEFKCLSCSLVYDEGMVEDWADGV